MTQWQIVLCVKGRPTTVSENQRTAEQWVVKVDGNDLKKLGGGESVEIGRKPLRPLMDDGYERLDIIDTEKSMSKRHAVFSVDEKGRAFVRDLDSTNGSYVVSPTGELMRLPVGGDFALPASPTIMQFGDVRVTFERCQDDDSTSDHQPVVSNLFEYAASDEAAQEPDAAGMSVDDILNLRAGEPTALFNARSVSNRVGFLRQAERQSFAPIRSNEPDYGELPSVSLVQPQHEDSSSNEPRDLFADAAAQASMQSQGPMIDRFQEHADEQAQEQEEMDRLRRMQDTVPVSQLSGGRFGGFHAEDASEQNANNIEPAVGAMQEAVNGEIVEIGDPETPYGFDAQENIEPQANDDERFRPYAEHSTVEYSAVEETAAASPEETAAFTPVFEPGSVFERVARGDFKEQEQTIEVDGLTSDDAKRTDDFTEQFEMARHPELLPFLAMNPSLYDDLYAWLGALGNQDVDAALSNNEGYAQYRKAVGK